ncbi:MAG: adenylate/guanylate cyclase domain-containing protein [Desulfovibrionaceae bacterium]
MLGLYVGQPSLLVQWDHKSYDIFLKNQPPGTPSPVPTIIDIDEKSLTAYGQWPWPRYIMAQLVEKLTQHGAAAIGLDFLFAEQDGSSPALLQQNLKKNFNIDLTFKGLPPMFTDNDALLAKMLAQSPSVLGLFLRFDGQGGNNKALPPPTGLVEQIPAGALPPREKLLTANGVTLPMPVLHTVTTQGFINIMPDADGLVRAAPLIMRSKNADSDVVYASLALRCLMQALNTKTMILTSGSDGLETIRIGGTTIPVSPEGLFHVPFRGGQGTYPYISVVDVLEDRVDPKKLAGRILLVGTSAVGLLDIRATPLDFAYPGVEVHASIIDAILSGRSITVPPWTTGAQVIAIVLTGLLCCIAFGLLKPLVYLPVALGLTAGAVFGSHAIFQSGLYLTPVYVMLTVIAEGVSLLSLRFWQADRQKRDLHKAFNRYVSPEVVSRIAHHGGDILAGEVREVSLLFTDVRGFTTLSEKLQPDQVVTLLNRYLTPMTALIRASGGTVDKFIGDAVMAFWNAPLDVENHPAKALRTLLDMHKSLKILNISLKKDFGFGLAMGGGIHTGTVHVGNMGSQELLDYTCIGDNVNLAARLERLCSRYGVNTILSDVTAARCGEGFILHKLDNIRVKGKQQVVTIFTAMEPEELKQRRNELSMYEGAHMDYEQGQFSAALKVFSRLQEKYPTVKLYGLYLERCKLLQATPPKVWDGVWTFDSK